MKLLLIFVVILALFFRCQANTDLTEPRQNETVSDISLPPLPADYLQEEQSELKSSRPKYQQEPPQVSTTRFTSPSLLPDKVIRQAYMRLQVKDYAASTKALKEYIAQRQAIITNAEEERTSGNLQNSLKIRVTNENFDQLVQDLQQESVYLEQKTITAKDVTEETIDNDARLKSRRKVEERYLALLAKANNVKEILAIEAELKSIQEEIDAAAATQKYLQNQVAYSTITLDYFQTTPAIPSPDNTITKRMIQALAAGWEGMVTVLLLLVQLWPVVLFISVLIFIYFRLRKTNIATVTSNFVE